MAFRLMITGATGFAGRALIEHFEARGHRIVAPYRRTAATFPGPEWVELGLDVEQDLANAFMRNKVDAIIHTAGRINGKPQEVIAANEGFCDHLLRALARAGQKPALYFLSSVSAIEPSGIYGQSKRNAEKMIAQAGLPRWAVLRASLIYGPLDTKNVAMLIRAARHWPLIPVVGGKKIKLQPLYVGDLADAFQGLVEGKGTNGAIYTVSGPRQERLTDMIHIIQDRIGRHVPVIPVPLAPLRPLIVSADRLFPFLNLPVQQIKALHDHPMYRSDEAQRDLDFHPRSFAEGIAQYL